MLAFSKLLAITMSFGQARAEGRPKMSPYRLWAEAVAFARRGWVAVAFLRRGYGRSQGEWVGASDIAAVAQFMSRQAYVSQGKWISVGSFATVDVKYSRPISTADRTRLS